MLPLLAGVDDLRIWMGIEIPVSSTPRAAAILAAASTVVRRETLSLWVDEEGELDPGTDELRWEAVQQVTVRVAERVYKNPDGNKQESTGPFSRSVEAWASLGCVLSDDEKKLLTGSGPVSGISVLTLTRGELETPRVRDYYSHDEWHGDI